MNARAQRAQLDAEFSRPESTMSPAVYNARIEELQRAAADDAPAPAQDDPVVTRSVLVRAITLAFKTFFAETLSPLRARIAALEGRAAPAIPDDLTTIGTRLSNVETRCGALAMMNGRGEKVAEVEALLRRVKALEGIEARIKALENRPAGMKYVGVYREGLGYESGSVVTQGGSMWCATATTTDKPGTSDAWTLCVKHGKHGRDAR